MKYLNYIIIALFLIACGSKEEKKENAVTETNVPTTTQEVNE